MSSFLTVGAILGGLALTACTDSMASPDSPDSPGSPTAEDAEPGAGALPRPTEPPPAAPACATTSVASWAGTASRHAENYPDDVEATVRWQLVDSTGCVDRYQPAGEAHYTYAIPGALCEQTITPATTAVAGGQGTLTIDRSTSPATYTASGSTSWTVTWTCTFASGDRETQTFAAGGAWLDASGAVVDGLIEGVTVEENGRQCGRGDSALPCTYSWSFAPAAN